MIALPTGVRVWIAAGHTDMRRGMHGLARQVQEALQRDPHAGDLYVFRERARRISDTGSCDRCQHRGVLSTLAQSL